MATGGVSCVVRQSFNRFLHPQKSKLLVKNVKIVPHVRLNVCPCAAYSSSSILNRPVSDVSVEYRHGLSVLSVPLPSRKESCEFVLKPVSHTVKDMIAFILEEDRGVDRVAVYRENGSKVAGSTTIDILLRTPFTISVNENTFTVTPPEIVSDVPSESLERFQEVKDITHKLYSQLNVEEFQLKREKEIISQLEEYKLQIAPFVKAKSAIEDRIHSRNKQLMYLGSTMMGFQFGFFARLTWFEYSWDVMEPVTYFATYAAVIGMYAYFAVTAQEYNYVDAWDREFLNKFYKVAEKEGFNIPEYNRLTNLIDQCESDLRRLRDPLQIHLPIREL